MESQLQQGDVVMLPGMHTDRSHLCSWASEKLGDFYNCHLYSNRQTHTDGWWWCHLFLPHSLFVMFSPSATVTEPIAAISQAVSAEGTCSHFLAPCKPHRFFGAASEIPKMSFHVKRSVSSFDHHYFASNHPLPNISMAIARSFPCTQSILEETAD